MKRYVLLCLFSLILPGLRAQQAVSTSQTAPVPVVTKEKVTSRIVFYRPKRYMGSGLTPSIYVNGEQVARLDNGRYFVVSLPPGTYKIESSMKHDPLELELKEGKVQFLEMVILVGNWRGGGRLIPTGQDDGANAIKKLKPLDKKWVKSEKVTFQISD